MTRIIEEKQIFFVCFDGESRGSLSLKGCGCGLVPALPSFLHCKTEILRHVVVRRSILESRFNLRHQHRFLSAHRSYGWGPRWNLLGCCSFFTFAPPRRLAIVLRYNIMPLVNFVFSTRSKNLDPLSSPSSWRQDKCFPFVFLRSSLRISFLSRRMWAWCSSFRSSSLA
jgi:hypothetical protein